IKMATVYGSEVGIGRNDLIGALLMVQIVAAPASIAFGRLARPLGPQRAVALGLAGYAAITLFGFYLSKPIHFWILAGLVAIVQGGTQALSRSMFASLTPRFAGTSVSASPALAATRFPVAPDRAPAPADAPSAIAASASFQSASASFTSSAFTFSSSCSIREAPMIALATCGRLSTQATATGAGPGRPRDFAHAPKRLAAATFSGVSAFSPVRKCSNLLVARLPAGFAPPAYLPVSTPCATGG